MNDVVIIYVMYWQWIKCVLVCKVSDWHAVDMSKFWMTKHGVVSWKNTGLTIRGCITWMTTYANDFMMVEIFLGRWQDGERATNV